MEPTEKMMTGEESLRVITEMINKTKVNISQSSFHLLFWGWLIFLCSTSDFLLTRFTDFVQHYLVWLLVIPGIFVSIIYGYIKGRNARVSTYANRIYMYTWIGFGITAIILFLIHYKSMNTFSPYIMILAGFATFLSGMILKFRPLVIGGITFWVLAIVVSFAGPVIAQLGMPVAVLAGYLIPGYILRNTITDGKI